MNVLDRVIHFFSPEAGLRRATARRAVALYEAAQPSRTRKLRNTGYGPNAAAVQGAESIRAQARHLEQNHDISRGILRVLVNNVVGAKGIGIEPQPRRADGSIHTEYAKALLEAHRDWQRTPEVTHQHHWARVQRMMCKTWLRDGESFAQIISGNLPALNHGTRVPLSLEMFEPDLIPYSLTDTAKNIRQGIECNAWGQPVAFHVLKTHPNETSGMVRGSDIKRIPASHVLHIAMVDRIGQLRGVSEFASVITRLDDIKDYEESERVAAKIAAMLTAYVKRGGNDVFDPNSQEVDANGNAVPREISFAPGMVIDTLLPGEDIGLIDSKRPNINLMPYRQGQLRAVSAGVGASNSSISKDYNGTYSAQRQEMVEQYVHYATLTDEFIGLFVRPVWEAFVVAAHLSGVVPIPADVVKGTEDDALYLGQTMPWIDPQKEANAWSILVRNGFASEVEVIRKRGQNPDDVLEQVSDWRKRCATSEVVFDSNPALVTKTGNAQPDTTPTENP